MKDRTETTYNKLIGRIDNAYYFLDDIFSYAHGLHGATATVLEPVPLDEYENTKTVEGLRNRGYDDLWQDAVSGGRTELGLDEWLELILNTDGDEGIWDLSGYDNWDQLREIGLTEEEYPIFICTGGGRSFSKDMRWDELYNKELWKKIRIAETQIEDKEAQI